MRYVLVVAAVVAGSPAYAQVEIRHVEHVEAFVKSEHAARIKALQNGIKALKRQIREQRVQREAVRLRVQLQQQERILAVMKRADPKPEDFVQPFEKGLVVGKSALVGSKDEWVRVGTVIDGQQFVGYVDTIEIERPLATNRGLEKGSVLAAAQAVGRPVRITGTTPYLFRGFDTSKLTTDARVTIAGVYSATGTASYTSVTGGKVTVVVIEPYDPKRPKTGGQ